MDSSITRMRGKPFVGCNSLKKVNITDLNAWFNTGFEEFNSNPLSCAGSLYVNGELLTTITIPDTVSIIKAYAFAGCDSITAVNITDMAAWCNIEFEEYDSNPLGCAGNLYLNGELLTSLVIPNSITEIKNYCFYNCKSITSVSLPNNLEGIGGAAFYGCSNLESVAIPDSITTIWSSSFAECDKIQYNQYDNAYYLGNPGNKYLCLIKAVSKDIPSCNINTNTRVIADMAFNECESITDITIPSSVRTINKKAFFRCHNLQSVTILSGTTYIGWYAFCENGKLESVILPDTVTTICYGAFLGCIKLQGINIPSSITSIGAKSFGYCRELADISYGGTVDEWNAIDKGVDWDLDTGDYTITCSNGSISK